MTLEELLDLCGEAIGRWELNRAHNPFPFVRLVLWRDQNPTGRTIRLFGNKGPSGRLDIVREKDGGYELVALFDATKVVNFLAANEEDPA